MDRRPPSAPHHPRLYNARRWPSGVLTLLLGAMLVLAACSGGGGTSAATSASASPTPSPTPQSSVVYVALGASDAVGVGADDPNTQGYVPLLIARLPTGPRPPLNLGVSGIHLRDALTQELPQAIPYQPTLVTVWLAGNDFKDCVPLQQYGTDLDTLLGQLQTKTHAQVFVANLPDMSLLPALQGNGLALAGSCLRGQSQAQIRALVEQWNSVIDQSVARHGDVLVDLFSGGLVNHPELISKADGFHPSTLGYKQLADLFWQQISTHGAVPSR